MKVLCVADHIDPLVYSVNARERFSQIDLVLSAGDLPMEYLGFLSSVLNKPVGFVFGNHNLQEYYRFKRGGIGRGTTRMQPSLEPSMRNYYGSTCMGDRVATLQGLIIAGLGGSRRYNSGLNQFSEFQMSLKILRLLPRLYWNRIFHGRYLDILITHASPLDIGDRPDPCHRGFKAFLWFMRKFSPTYLIHGHVHLYDLNAQRVYHYKDTTIINVYDHFVLDTEAVYE